MIRTTALLAVLVSFLAFCPPAAADGQDSFLFYGIVTVRDGKMVLFQNPALSDEQVAKCAKSLEGFIDLDRTFTTAKDDKGKITYTWGDDEGQLSEAGLVPCAAYYVTPGQYIDVNEVTITPYVGQMGSSTSSTSGMATLRWWAPETTKQCDLALEYYDDSSNKAVAKLEGKAIVLGASGTSPDGVAWKIAGIEEKKGNTEVNVETGKGPDGHEFVFWAATTDWKTPNQMFAWPERTKDRKGFRYSVSCWAETKDELVSFEIRERHPDRLKNWAIKAFALKAN